MVTPEAPVKLVKKCADHGGDNCRTAPKPPHEGGEHMDQTFRSSPFSQEVTRQGKKRDSGQGGVNHHPVMIDGNRSDRAFLSPRKG